MEIFEQTSLMTWKARRCIYRLLLVFDNFGDEIPNTANTSVEHRQYHHNHQQQQTGHLSIQEYAEQAINDLLQQYNHDELFDSDVSFMELYSSIPLCE
ncbi:hypothetical protein Plec18167_009406 [Paecilomyces lecythidis]|uniref:Uncharacterized protein n=1 Tax=Paecilomyces lecythidis TaxID=3004212 RepID=A0ABR3WPI5_9EURO